MHFAPEYGVKMTLTGPNGIAVVFNDPTDPAYVGMLTNITGLDSADVRDSGEALVGFDGGVQGPNWFGRRPLVLEGMVFGTGGSAARNAKVESLLRAAKAMRADAVLSWIPSGETDAVSLNLRCQQPPRVTGGWHKAFQLSMVASDPRVYGPLQSTFSDTISSGSVQVFSSNAGADITYPVIRLAGPMTAPTVTVAGPDNTGTVNVTHNLALEDILYIDTLKRTVKLGTRRIRRNIFTTPSFEGATAALTANASTTFTPNVTMPSVSSGWGSKVATLASTATPTSISAVSAVFTGNPFPPVGGWLAVSWSALSAATSRRMKIQVEWLNSSNTVTSTVTDTYATATSTTVWRRHAASFARPSSLAVKARVTFFFEAATGTIANSEIHYLDGVVIEPTPSDFAEVYGTQTGTFFDGSLTDTETTMHSWDGTANASGSTQGSLFSMEEFVPDLGVEMTSVYSYLDHTLTDWPGMDPGSCSVLVDGVATGGSLYAEWRSAWL